MAGALNWEWEELQTAVSHNQNKLFNVNQLISLVNHPNAARGIPRQAMAQRFRAATPQAAPS